MSGVGTRDLFQFVVYVLHYWYNEVLVCWCVRCVQHALVLHCHPHTGSKRCFRFREFCWKNSRKVLREDVLWCEVLNMCQRIGLLQNEQCLNLTCQLAFSRWKVLSAWFKDVSMHDSSPHYHLHLRVSSLLECMFFLASDLLPLHLFSFPLWPCVVFDTVFGAFLRMGL